LFKSLEEKSKEALRTLGSTGVEDIVPRFQRVENELRSAKIQAYTEKERLEDLGASNKDILARVLISMTEKPQGKYEVLLEKLDGTEDDNITGLDGVNVRWGIVFVKIKVKPGEKYEFRDPSENSEDGLIEGEEKSEALELVAVDDE